MATVVGVGSIASAPAGGMFLIFGREALIDWTSLQPQWFDLILGATLIVQLVYAPEGAVVDAEKRIMRRLRPPTPPPVADDAEALEAVLVRTS